MLRMAQNANTAPSAVAFAGPATSAVKLSEAVAIYLRLKGQGRPVTFHRAAERSCGYVIDVCGDRDITAYPKRHLQPEHHGLRLHGFDTYPSAARFLDPRYRPWGGRGRAICNGTCSRSGHDALSLL
jgi:hypothetical protein